MAKLVWRVKRVTEVQAGETTEVEVARIERDEQAGLSDLRAEVSEFLCVRRVPSHPPGRSFVAYSRSPNGFCSEQWKFERHAFCPASVR